MNANLVAASNVPVSGVPDDSGRASSAKGRAETKPSQCFADSRLLAEFRRPAKTDKAGDETPLSGLSRGGTSQSAQTVGHSLAAKRSLSANGPCAQGKSAGLDSVEHEQCLGQEAPVLPWIALTAASNKVAAAMPTQTLSGNGVDPALRMGSPTRRVDSVGSTSQLANTSTLSTERQGKLSNVLPVQSAKAASTPIAQPAQEQNVARQSESGRESSETIPGVKQREVPSAKSKSITTELSMTRQGSSGQVEKDASSAGVTGVSSSSKPRSIAGEFLEKLSPKADGTAENTAKPQAIGDKPSASSPSKPGLDTQADSRSSSSNPNGTTNPRQLDVGDSVASGTSTKDLNIFKDKDVSVSQKENVSAAGSSPIRLSATSADAVKVPQNPNPAPTSQSIAEQIAESVSGSTSRSDGNIVVRLNPPELGTVVLKFQQQSDEVNGLLEVSKSQTKYEIEQVLPQILRSLQDGGIQIKKLEVVLMDQTGVTADKGQTGNGPSAGPESGQHGFRHEDAAGPVQPLSTWLADARSGAEALEPQMQLGHNRIDMLA